MLHAEARESRAVVESTDIIGYLGGDWRGLSFVTGGGYSWISNHVGRTVAFPGYSSGSAARYDGGVLHGFSELALAGLVWGGRIKPFVGIEGYRVTTDAFAEAGGATALTGARRGETFAFADAGLRVATPIASGLGAHAWVGWQHALRDLDRDAVVRFAGGGRSASSAPNWQATRRCCRSISTIGSHRA